MPWTSDHLTWLVDTRKSIKTIDGLEVRIFKFSHETDEAILSAWAKHFRNHYCLDSKIDILRGSHTRSDYLKTLVFPCDKMPPGPSIRAGDFAEILIADYVEFRLGYWVPRVRWSSKAVRNESVKGSDVVGFRYSEDNPSKDDEMLVFESKAQLSKKKPSRLQDAINDSAKDEIRIAETLNFLKRRFHEESDDPHVKYIERFQNPDDHPYKERYAAAAIFSDDAFDNQHITLANAKKIPVAKKAGSFKPHPHRNNLILLVISGPALMNLANALYRRAADEA